MGLVNTSVLESNGTTSNTNVIPAATTTTVPTMARSRSAPWPAIPRR